MDGDFIVVVLIVCIVLFIFWARADYAETETENATFDWRVTTASGISVLCDKEPKTKNGLLVCETTTGTLSLPIGEVLVRRFNATEGE